MIEIFGNVLSYSDLTALLGVGLLIGMAKTGVHGAGMIAVPLLAIVFGGKDSSGIMLPILMFADVFGVYYYHRHAKSAHLKRLIPAAFMGVVAGTIAGQYINDQIFRQLMAVFIFGSLIIMIWMERSKMKNVPTSRWFAISMGILGGFTSMVGNLAGSVMALYLLSMKLPKNEFIGTAAWFFMILNFLKVPFHVFGWKTITMNSFMMDTLTIPAVAIGAWLGVFIIKYINDNYYRWFIILSTFVAAIFMVL